MESSKDIKVNLSDVILIELTSELALRDWLLDAEVEPPPAPATRVAKWAEWWDARQGRWADWQREKMWEALDRARQYEVAERTAGQAYVLVEIGWSQYDERERELFAGAEGGRAVRAFTTRRRAEAHRADLERERKQQGGLAGHRFILGGRPGHEHWTYTLEDVLLYEVVEVEREGLLGRRVYLAQRRSLRSLDGGWRLCRQPNRSEGASYAPLRLFDVRARAEEFARGLGRIARREVNPFDFPNPYDYDFSALTSLSEIELQQRIADLGLVTPEERTLDVGPTGPQTWIDWSGWWRRTVGTMMQAQRDGVWDLLDRLRLYEVFPLDLGE